MAQFPSRGRAGYALALLMAATFTALLDRYLIGLLLQPIRADFHITDTQASLLQGFAFAIFYSLLGVPFGRWVDRSNRRNIIIVGVFLWSAMTICCGLARTYPQLFLARLGVGIGEACLAPAAYSMITDLFPAKRHGRALALFTLSSVIGGGGSFLIGAKVLALAAASDWALPAVGVLEPWRVTFIVVGLPGLVVAAFMLTIREPARHGQFDPDHQPSLRELGAFLRCVRKPLAALVIANSALSIAGTGIIGWMAVFLARTYGVPATEGGHWIGMVLIASALIGGPLTGWLADSRRVARLHGEKLVIMAWGCAAAIGPAILFPLAPTANAALAIFLVHSILYNFVACSAPAMLQDILPNRFKGQVSALYWLCVGLVGFGVGSTAVAFTTDYVLRDNDMLRYSLICVAVPCFAIAMSSAILARSSYQAVRDEMAASGKIMTPEE